MRPATPTEATRIEDFGDAALVERARQRDGAAFWLIMKRHNQRLYRVAYGILGDDAEAEDVVEEGYVRAFAHLSEFRGEARLSTWLTRIVLNEALVRRQRRHTAEARTTEALRDPANASILTSPSASLVNPEAAIALAEIRLLLERAVSHLPTPYRAVFIMRDIEEMSTEETALHLGLNPRTVRTRLHRARRLLRAELQDRYAAVFTDTFPFAGARCDRVTQAVLDRLGIALPAKAADRAATVPSLARSVAL
jgi:RNA polymerase sigma factor (sigma-70 family)